MYLGLYIGTLKNRHVYKISNIGILENVVIIHHADKYIKDTLNFYAFLAH